MKKLNFTGMMTIIIFLILVFSSAAPGAEWPTKQLNIVVPYETGGTTDRVVRVMVPYLQKELGVPVVVVNRPGGGGLVGTKAHLKNDPDDGSFICYTIQPYLSSQVIKGAFSLEDFAYIGVNYWSPQSIWVKTDSKFKALQELLVAIKNSPAKIKHAYLPNSWSQVVIAMLAERIGAEPKGIPYDGGGPQRIAVISREVDFAVTEVYGTLAGAGADMRMLCVFEKERLAQFPDVPTVNEVMKQMGYQEFPVLSNFRFFFVKKGFKDKYPDRWDKLVKAFEKIDANPELRDLAAKQKLYLSWKGPDFARKAIHEAHQFAMKFKEYWK